MDLSEQFMDLSEQFKHMRSKMENVVKLYNFEYEICIDSEDEKVTFVIFDKTDQNVTLEFTISKKSTLLIDDKDNNQDNDQDENCLFYPGLNEEYIDFSAFNDPPNYDDEFYAEAYDFADSNFDSAFENHIEPAMHLLLHAFSSGMHPEYYN